MKRKAAFFVFFIIFQKLYGLEIQITAKDLGVYFTPEYNRAFDFCWDISTIGSIELNNRFNTRSGLALGAAGRVFDVDFFAVGETFFDARIPLFISLAYKYNGLPEYGNHTHSIPLLVSFKGRRAGITMGPNFRLTSFFGGPPVYEPVMSVSVYMILVDNDFLRLELKSANFDNFTSGNFGAYYLNLNGVIRLSEKLSMIHEVEIRQSGGAALTSNFYGFVYRGGIKFSW